MNVEYINPFIRSVSNVFDTMLNCSVARGDIWLKSDSRPSYMVSGVIGLSGQAFGMVVLSLPEKIALKSAAVMLMEETTTLNADVLDAVGELTNIIAGGAKAELVKYQMSVSMPSVITGHDHEVHFPLNIRPIGIPFKTDWGDFALEVGLSEILFPSRSKYR